MTSVSVLACQKRKADSDSGEGEGCTCAPNSSPMILKDIPGAYLVISKPADVRMNGDHEVTVEKLLAQWYPSHTSIFYPVHQLDYATSGVLCSALSKEAASAAAFAFQSRTTKKVYVALLQGTVDFSRLLKEYHNPWDSTDEGRSSQHALHELESQFTAKHLKQKYKAPNPDKEKETVSTWQDAALLHSLRTHMTVLQDVLTREIAPGGTDGDVKDIVAPLRELQVLGAFSVDEYCKDKRLRKRLRRALKLLGVLPDAQPPSEALAFQQYVVSGATKTDEASGKGVVVSAVATAISGGLQQSSVQSEEEVDYPTVVCMVDINGRKLLRVRVPIAPTESFEMQVGGRALGGRYAETEVEIREEGLYQGYPVTKVVLRPLTGRRHQLRLHCLHLNHPIVGDMTYNKSKEVRDAERMMLHALSLQVTFDPKKFERIKVPDVPDILNVTDCDPFELDGPYMASWTRKTGGT